MFKTKLRVNELRHFRMEAPPTHLSIITRIDEVSPILKDDNLPAPNITMRIYDVFITLDS